MWSKYQTSIAVAISFAIILSMFWFVQSMAMAIFISLLLTILLNPAVDYLEAKKIPRIIAAAICLTAFIAFVFWMLLTVSKTFIPTLAEFIADIPRMADSLKNLPPMQNFTLITEEFENLFKGFATFSVTALKSSLSIVISIFNRFLDFIITLFMTFYLLKDGKEIKTYLANLFPKKDKMRVLKLFNSILGALSSYIQGQLIVCTVTGVFVFLYFTIRDIPYASVFAVLSAVGEFIPVVGPTIASAFGALFSFTESPAVGAQTVLFYVVLTQANHNVVYPYLIGKSLNLHPIAIMLGILFGGEILGALGMFLAVPCMVTIKLIIEDIFHYRDGSRKNE